MKQLINFLSVLVLVVLASCECHQPSGVLIGKQHQPARTTHRYCPATHTLRPHRQPEHFIFIVACDSCHKEHRCTVERAVYDRFNVGDTVTAKGYYLN